MCGITAISRPNGRSSVPNLHSFAVDAAIAIEHRGPHATGFGWTDAQGHPWYWKSEGTASLVAPQLPLPVNVKALIGHTRWATQGDPSNNRNNHPVTAPGLVLVHNGCISNDAEIFRMLGVEREAEVDSEAIAALLAYGPEALDVAHPADLLELIEGDFALAWLDSEDPHVLHLARGAGRPMAIGKTRRGDLVMSSTKSTLRDLSRQARVGIERIRDVPEGTYLRVERGMIVERRRFTPYRRPVLVSASRGSSTPATRDRGTTVKPGGSRPLFVMAPDVVPGAWPFTPTDRVVHDGLVERLPAWRRDIGVAWDDPEAGE